MRYDAIVIGGGVAGLAAAGRLGRAGRRVLLLEARPRLGGRIHTVIDSATGHPVELGAEFAQGRVSELNQIIREGGLTLDEMPERHLRGEGGVKELPPVEDLVDRLLELAGPELSDVPVARLIEDRARTRFSPDELAVLTRFLESFHAADLRRFGVEALRENQAAETRDGWGLFRITGGYRELVSLLESRLDPMRVEIRTDTVVSQVRWTRRHVEIEARSAVDNTSQVLNGTQAILTLPLGLLKAPDGTTGTVHLEPSPPGWEEAFGALEMGVAERVDLRFDSPWWIARNRAVPGFVHGRDEPFPVWWTTSPPELPFLTGWTGGPRALALAGLSHDDVVRLALESVSKVFEMPLSALEKSLGAGYWHDWATDPFSRGAYSYGGIGARAARALLRKPVAGTLFLAGEAVAEGGRNATVAGALISGLRSADALLSTPMVTHS